MKPDEMMKDERPIRAAWWNQGRSGHRVGQDGVTAIVAYGEPGSMAYTPFLAFYIGKRIWKRVSALDCEVHYE